MTLAAFTDERIVVQYRRAIEHPRSDIQFRVGWLAEVTEINGFPEKRELAVGDRVIVCERRRYDGPTRDDRAHHYHKGDSYGFSPETVREFRKRAGTLFVIEVDHPAEHPNSVLEYDPRQFYADEAFRVRHPYRKPPDNQRHVSRVDARDRHSRDTVHVIDTAGNRKWEPGEFPADYPDGWRPATNA